jgi:hypothetical protein
MSVQLPHPRSRGVDSIPARAWSQSGGEVGLCNLHVVPPGNLVLDVTRATVETQVFDTRLDEEARRP